MQTRVYVFCVCVLCFISDHSYSYIHVCVLDGLCCMFCVKLLGHGRGGSGDQGMGGGTGASAGG